MTSDIDSKVIGQPGQETDEIGKLSVRRELETHRNIIVRPEITTKTCKSQKGVYLEALSEDWTYKPLLSHVKFRTPSPAVGDRAICELCISDCILSNLKTSKLNCIKPIATCGGPITLTSLQTSTQFILT